MATPYDPVYGEDTLVTRCSRPIGAERKPLAMIQTSVATHIAMSSVDRKSEAACD